MDGIPVFLHVLVCLILKNGVVHATTCGTKFSDASFLKDFNISASSESTKNKASDVFTVGWCASTSDTDSPHLDVDFKLPFGISGIIVASPTNKDSNPYPTSVLVKYVPNGGNANNFVNFPLQEGKLEIKMNQSGQVQTNFGTGIAARELQFTVQGFHEEPCFKIDLIGCTINELCTGGCQQNGGLCITQDMCQCPQGKLGDNCELKACVPADLGLADGSIGADHVTVSSQDSENTKAEIGNAGNKKGWCPSSTDKSPWVQVKLDQPKAVSVFKFMWSNKGGHTIMREFELQYIAVVDSTRQFRTFTKNIPAMNNTHAFQVTIDPVVVTDTIRIIPSIWENSPCFKLEIQGCDPKALCSTGWCQNGGTCMGKNVCVCPKGFVGSRCEQAANQISATNMTFVKIENNIIETTTTTLQFLVTGSVHLEVVNNIQIVTISGTNSSIILQNNGKPSCVTDVNMCTNGFTLAVDINFAHLLENTYIVSSGGNLPGHSGIALYYSNNQLHYIVSTTTQTWTVVVNYPPVLHTWQHFELTWNKHLGIEILVNGHSLGSNAQPSPKPNSSKVVNLCIGCSHTSINVNINMQITAIHSWSLDRTELVNAGVKEPSATATTPVSTDITAATTNPTSTTTKPSTAAATTTAPVTTKCVPADLGLADGSIGTDHVTVSSQDSEYTKAEIGNAGNKKGWCPSSTDKSPWVQVKLDQPKAVSVFKFMWSNKGGQTIMREFELQYIAALDSTRRFRTFAKNIPAMNNTHIFQVTIDPVVVTDTIRIIPSNWDDSPCFKLEIQGCDPKALCLADWCQNGGTCMGQNVCVCPKGFVGSRCEQSANQISATNMTFVKIENHIILTTTTTLQFLVTGSVHLEVVNSIPIVTISGTNSSITLQSNGTPSCVTDVNLCTNGFTLAVDINFGNLLENTYIVSSGGNLPGHSGIALYYSSNQLHYIVSTTTQTWTVVVNYPPVLHTWQHFELTWNKHLGIEILVNGHSLGSNAQPSPKPNSSKVVNLCIGCSHTTINVNISMQITAIHSWSLDRTELVNAGVKEPPATATTPVQVTAATTEPTSPATTKPSTAAATTTAPVITMTTPPSFLQYNLTFLSVINNILVTPSFNFTLHNKPTLELENNSHTALVLDCSKQQYVELPDQGIPCLESLKDCSKGFTFKLEVLFTKLEPVKKIYILSSGGDVVASSGMAIYIQSNQLIFGVKQEFMHWSGRYDMTGFIQTNKWYRLEVSWEASKGILVIVDRYEVIKDSNWTPSPPNDKTNPVLIGKTEGSNETACMKVRDLFTWTTHREVLVDQGIVQAPMKTTTTTSTTSTSPPTTTTTTTTPSTTTQIPVPTYTWNLTAITNNIIIGNHYNLTVHGGPVVVSGGIQINSSTQYIEFGSHKENCLIKPETCSHGLTVRFTIQFKKYEENTYFFTSGGQLPDGVGLAVIYRFGKIQFILTTTTQSWFINCKKSDIPPNKFHTIMLSWQITAGLEVFINNVLIEATKVPDPHQSALVNATTVYFGKQPTSTIKVDFVLQTITIWYVHVDILVEQGKCEPPVRPTTKPTTQSTKPTSAATKPSATSSRSTLTSLMTTGTQQCPAGCVSITTAQSKPTTKQPVTTAKPVTSKPTTAQPPATATTRKSTTKVPTTKPKPSATTSSIVPTPNTATPPPPTTRKPIPDFNQLPTIHVTVEKDKNAYIACSFKPTAQKDVQIEASLIVEGKISLVITVGGNTGVAMFAVSKVDMYLYSKEIKCSVKARYIGSTQTTQHFVSNIFKPNIAVTPGRVIVIEGHSTEFVTVTSNVPPQFYCCTGCKGQCQVHIVGTFHYDRHFQKCGNDIIAQAVIESTKPPNFNEHICGYALTVTNWEQHNKIQIKATVDGRRDGDHTNDLDIIAQVYNQPQTAQITVKPDHFIVTTVKVTVKDNDHTPSQCKSMNDPHMTTFDGQRYNNMKEGEFILYRHKSLPFEVRAIYYKCSKRSHATCNCAVAVKSGDDVITVTGCQGTVAAGHPGQGHGIGLLLQQLFGSHGNAHGHNNRNELAKTPMTIQIYKNGEMTPGTYIRRIGCGQKYEIELPTGMVVTVQQSWKPFINIWIRASSSDRGQVEGLCGNFDGSRSNDLKPNVNHVINAWHVNSGNFFYGVGVSSHSVTSTFCSCVHGKNRVCLAGLGVLRCASSRYDITATLVQHAKLPVLSRHKRQANTEPAPSSTDIPPDGDDVTYEEAVKKCEEKIMSSKVTTSCTPILTSNLTEQIDNCAHDYNETGNFEWAADALRDIIVDCVDAANTIRVANETGNTNVTDEFPDIENIDEVLSKLQVCLEDCGDHGNCTDGVCVCDDGYSGVNCNISKQTKPTVLTTAFLCDVINTADCMAAPIFGDNFVESDSLICHYEFVQVGDKVTVTGNKGQIRAVYISINQVTCLLPRLQSARLTISNDGQSQSDNTTTHVVYSSVCFECTETPTCTRKEGNCLIDGGCYEEGITRHGDDCQICRPVANSTAWSRNNIDECVTGPIAVVQDNDKEKTQILVLAIVCGVLAAIILIGVICCVKSKIGKRSSKGEYGEYNINGAQKIHREPFKGVDNLIYDEKL